MSFVEVSVCIYKNVIITTLPMLLLMLSYLSGKKVRSQIPELDY